MKFHLSITRGNTTTPVETRLADVVEYETVTGRSITAWATNPPGVSDVARLAYLAESRPPRKPFEEWLEDVDEVALTDVTTADPTPPAVSPAPPSK